MTRAARSQNKSPKERRVQLKDDPSDEAVFFEKIQQEDEFKRAIKLKNDRQEQDNLLSKHYARRAYRFSKCWVGFLLIFIPVQMILQSCHVGLTEKEFISVVGALSGSILGGDYPLDARMPIG